MNIADSQVISKPQLPRRTWAVGNSEFSKLVKVALLHVPLGVLLYAAPRLGLVHPLAVIAVGFYWIFIRRAPIMWIAYLCAYLVGCEVLWRMAGVPVFWEFGKYGISVMMIAALLRDRKFTLPLLPTVYLALLIPSTVLTIAASSFSDARDKISFNLSGPFALFVCCWFFSALTVNRNQVKKIFYSAVLPIVTIGATTLFFTVQAIDSIEFNTESNFATSGGFGPNQVSSILGLGAFVALSLILLFDNNLRVRLLLLVTTAFLTAQSVMTFSRGGMYNAVLAAAVVVAFQAQDFRKSIKRFLPVAGGLLLFLVFLFPFLNDLTGGKLEERFEDTGTTNRTEIVSSDFQLLAENPIFGVGLGQSREERERIFGHVVASHTEFSRLISDHGSFGILALFALGMMTLANLYRQRDTFGRALLAGSVFWCAFFMLNAGMRLAAPSFMWGLMFLTIVNQDRPRLVGRPPDLRFSETRETHDHCEG